MNIHERNLLKQTLSFISGFNAKTIDDKKLSAYRKALDEDPKRAEAEFSRVVIILSHHIDEIQSNVFGNFYRSYVRGAVSWEKLCELSEANRRMFVADYELLRQTIEQPDGEISTKRMYQYDRLVSLGMIQRESVATGATTLGSSTFTVTPVGITVTPFGKTFYQHMQPHTKEIIVSE